jgi:site-specific recombinase XerD
VGLPRDFAAHNFWFTVHGSSPKMEQAMHETLFCCASTLAHYRSAPLLTERERFLQHCAKQGYARSGLERIAWLLRIVAESRLTQRRIVRRADLDRMAHAYCESTQLVLLHIAAQWFAFMGEPRIEAIPEGRFSGELIAFETFMREERGLSPMTILTRREQLCPFFERLERLRRVRSLQQVTLRHIDRYFIEQSQNGWSRASLATLAGTLRSFFYYSEAQCWCQKGLAASIDAPRLYAQEGLPRGPDWKQVQALIARTGGDSPVSIRDRAIVMLLAIYGLRRAEVAGLRLEDLDFENELIRITRPKQRRTQQYPLIGAVGEALLHYLQDARPRCDCRSVFLTINAPRRALSASSISAVVRWRLRTMGVEGIPCGAHGLRHACAKHLLATGFSFKQIGDHLGHRRASSTSLYAKVDLKGLREVAELSLGRLV